MNQKLKFFVGLITSVIMIFAIIPAFSQQIKLHPQAILEPAYIEQYGDGSWNGFLPEPGLIDDITWSNIDNAPSTFGRAYGGVIGNYFYVFGGQYTTSLAIAYSFSDRIWVNSTPSIYSGGYNAGCCVAGGSLYRIGGMGTAGYTPERFEPAGDGTGSWFTIAAPPSEFRTSTNGCAWDGGNFIYVNNCNYATPPIANFARYNIAQNSWEVLTPPPGPRRFAGLAALDGKIYLIGGLGASDRDYNRCQVYVPDSLYWRDIARHPDSLNFTSTIVVATDSYIWTVGHGGGYSIYTAYPHVHYYDPVTDSWTAENDLPTTRGLALAGYDPILNRLMRGGGNFGGGGQYQSDCYVGEGLPTDIRFESIPLPEVVSLSAYPNPFNASTNICFKLREDSNIKLDVYNLAGQKVKRLVAGEYPAGEHAITWNGANNDRHVVNSGVYFIKISAGEYAGTAKLLLLK